MIVVIIVLLILKNVKKKFKGVVLVYNQNGKKEEVIYRYKI